MTGENKPSRLDIIENALYNEIPGLRGIRAQNDKEDIIARIGKVDGTMESVQETVQQIVQKIELLLTQNGEEVVESQIDSFVESWLNRDGTQYNFENQVDTIDYSLRIRDSIANNNVKSRLANKYLYLGAWGAHAWKVSKRLLKLNSLLAFY